MAKWVIRRVSDGAFWSDYASEWVGAGSATIITRWTHSEKEKHEARDAQACPESRLVKPGEEWVELDDAGRPVEAKAVAEPKRLFVMRSPSGLYHMGCGDWTEHIARAMTYAQAWTPSGPADVMVPVLVHPDGAVTLDKPAPVAQGANAGPVVGWVLTDGKGFYERGTGNFVLDLERAAAYPCKQEVWSSGQASVPFGHRDDGSRFLLPTAPAVAQPSPYSEDEPIPYRLTERRVYLASALPNRGRATALAAQLARDGVEIVSTWHDRDDATVEREAAVDRNELAAIAEGCLAEIDSATDLVWMHWHAEGRVGAAVEVGYALARGKRLLLLSLDGSPAPSAFGALGAAVTVSGLYRAVAR